MKKTVKVTANPETGSVFTPYTNLGKDGKQYGYVRVESTNIDWNAPVARVKTRSALKTMAAEEFAKVAEHIKAGSEIEGQIIRKDSLTPQYEGQRELEVSVKDENNNIIEGEMRKVTSGGLPVYRQDIFTTDLEAKDELLKYDAVVANGKAPASPTVLAK